MADDGGKTPQQPTADNVVRLHSARDRAAKRVPVAPCAMPSTTGLASFVGHSALLDNLRSSALTDATIDAARLFAAPHTEWKRWGFRGHSGAASCFFPFFEPGAAEPYDYRHRPLRPRVNSKTGRTMKYEQRPDTGALVYFPPLPGQQVALRDIAQPLLLTEGEKTGLFLAQQGFATVALTGVSSWGDKAAREAGNGTRLHPQLLRHCVIAGRDVVIAYDADARTNEKVMLPLQRLAGALVAAGAARVSMCLPPDAGDAKGHDDFGFKYGAEASRNLLLTVREAVDAIAPDLGALPLSRFKALRSAGLDHLRVPAEYEIDDRGQIWKPDEKDPDARQLVAVAPLVLSRVLTDLYTNEVRFEFRFRDSRGHWSSVALPRAIAGGRNLEPELRRVGGMVIASRMPLVNEWLEAFETCNGQLIEHVHCVHSTGWHDAQFMLDSPVLPQREPGDERDPIVPVVLERRPDHDRIFGALRLRPRAELAAHTAALNTAASAATECAVAIYAALAAPLLGKLALPNFAVHLCGESSRGKSSMLRCAASVFGDPNNPAWVASWNATLTGVEQRAATLTDLPQCYDEAGSATPEHLQTAVYMLINGEGRTRSQMTLGLRATENWHTVVLSTGEFELADPDAAQTGAQVRVVSLPVLGFGGLDAAGVDAVREACAAHAGAFGRAWLQWLVDLNADDWAELRAVYEQHLLELRAAAKDSGNPLDARVAGFFATLALAERQACDQFGLGAVEGATMHEAFRDRLQGDGGALSLATRVLRALHEWRAQEPHSFPRCTLELNGSRSAPDPHGNRVNGWVREDGALLLLPGATKARLDALNLHWHPAVRRELVAQGALAGDDGTNERSGVATSRMRINGEQQRVYVLTRIKDPP